MRPPTFPVYKKAVVRAKRSTLRWAGKASSTATRSVTSDAVATVDNVEAQNPWRVAFESTSNDGVQIVNTFHVKADGGPLVAAPSPAQVRDAMYDAFHAKYKNLLSDNVTWQTITVTEEVDPNTSEIPATSVKNIGEPGNRAIANTKLAGGLCIVAKTVTGAAVRSGHGRLFLPPAYTDGEVAQGGNWYALGQYWAQAKIFLDELMESHDWDALTDGHLYPCVYSRTRRRRGDEGYYFRIDDYVMRIKQHFLRSRMSAP
jgi:hypothetical protein